MKRMLAIFLAVILGMAVSNTPAAAYSNLPRVVAHQTGGDPENTVTGAKFGIKYSSFLDVDVRFTSDGVPVLFHDPDMARLTNLSGSVESKTWNTVSNARYDANTSLRPNKVSDIYRDILKPNPGVTIILEIKDQTLSSAQINKLWSDVRAYGVGSRVIMASFSIDAIKKMKASSPPSGVRWGLNDSGALTSPATADANASFYIVDKSDINESEVSDYRDRGLYVIVYTANSKASMDMAIELRANAVMTDDPEEFKDVLARRR